MTLKQRRLTDLSDQGDPAPASGRDPDPRRRGRRVVACGSPTPTSGAGPWSTAAGHSRGPARYAGRMAGLTCAGGARCRQGRRRPLSRQGATRRPRSREQRHANGDLVEQVAAEFVARRSTDRAASKSDARGRVQIAQVRTADLGRPPDRQRHQARAAQADRRGRRHGHAPGNEQARLAAPPAVPLGQGQGPRDHRSDRGPDQAVRRAMPRPGARRSRAGGRLDRRRTARLAVARVCAAARSCSAKKDRARVA